MCATLAFFLALMCRYLTPVGYKVDCCLPVCSVMDTGGNSLMCPLRVCAFLPAKRTVPPERRGRESAVTTVSACPRNGGAAVPPAADLVFGASRRLSV
jgi:hypothetical protein